MFEASDAEEKATRIGGAVMIDYPANGKADKNKVHLAVLQKECCTENSDHAPELPGSCLHGRAPRRAERGGRGQSSSDAAEGDVGPRMECITLLMT
jgi:hypothetical protein